jgi:hypothetical protein
MKQKNQETFFIYSFRKGFQLLYMMKCTIHAEAIPHTEYDYIPDPFKDSHFLTVYNSCEVINVWARGRSSLKALQKS